MEPDDSEEILDLLAELQHDLGKYLRLPLALLPRDAPEAELRRALRRALLQTRKGPVGVQAASDLWSAFRAEAGEWADQPALGEVGAAVERALRWRSRLEDPAPLDRGRLESDLGEVQAAIRRAMTHIATGALA